ncbi:MAG: hypothetical protein LDLANPLL_02607 [Turneriella sp.]|nr:hypothetical protein [Turneriella sp.]
MPVFVLIAVCFLSGILLRHFKKLPENTHFVLNNFIIYVSLPALIIKSLRTIPMTGIYFSAALMPWLIFFGAVFFFLLLERFKVIERQTTIALILTAGLGNTSFVGFPVIEALYGKQFIPVGVIIDEMGTFLVMCLVAIPLADFLRIGEFNLHKAIKDLVLFPPMIALVLAFLFQVWRPPEVVFSVSERLGDTLAPLALISVGFQWQMSEMKQLTKQISLGLGYKLLLAPLLTLFVYSLFTYNTELKKIVMLEAAMGPMITGGIIAIQKNIQPKLVAAMLSVGIPLSLLTSLVVKLIFR